MSTRVPKEGHHALPIFTLLVSSDLYRKPPLRIGSPQVITPWHILMRHIVNKAKVTTSMSSAGHRHGMGGVP